MKTKRRKKASLKELQDHWYEKLKDEGFEDIEDISNPDRPLKEWHSRKFKSEASRIRQEAQEQYDKKMADFLNGHAIDEICALIVRHGNSSIGAKRVRRILELHRAGNTERKIARKVRCGKKCVHSTLVKAKQWMKVA